jgi:ABC-type transport system involved in multi-copper enzyme maturation permease subunit
MTFVSMSLKNQALAIVFNLMIILLLPSLLSILTVLPVESDAVTTVLKGIPYSVLGELLSTNLLSMGAAAETTGLSSLPAISGGFAARILLVSLAYTVVSTVVGALIFNNADIK